MSDVKPSLESEPAPLGEALRPPSVRGGAPLLGAIIAVCLAVTMFLWFTLRAVESNRADEAHERLALVLSSDLQSQIESYIRSINGIAGSLSQTDGTSLDSEGTELLIASRFGRVLARNDLIVADSAVSEVALIGIDAQATTVLALFGTVDPAAFVGQPIQPDSPLSSLLETAADQMGPTAAPTEELGVLFEDDAPGVVLVSPILNDDDSVAGFVVGRFHVSTVVDAWADIPGGQQVALSVALGNTPVAATSIYSANQAPFGEPSRFDAGGVSWTISVADGGLEVSRAASWTALISGLVLAALAGFLGVAARRNAITIRRLRLVEHDSRHDPLTGLVNREGLTEALNNRILDRRTNNLVGVLLLDLDRLKVVNDSIGHSAGDEVLNAVADRLRQTMRDEDIVGRFGGDEFVVVSAGVPAIKDLVALADRILESLKEPAVLSDESSQMISASIGIAYVSNGDATAESLLRDADVAMYKAKEAGGSRYVVFDSELREQAVARLEVERELRRAIRTGQLVVHYQPIVDTETGGVDRLEALVRWQHPVRGMIPPGAFLSVAAESGLIVDVGEHVLRESCRQAALWSSAVGRPIMVAVNVAERQLIDSGLLELVKRVLAETGIDPGQLELELTEELIVERLDARLTILRDLVDLGVKLSIDDFGTSRASLSQLKRLDMVSTLKIDRAFVIDVATDAVDRKIITAIVALADSMGMDTVAEGVEDADQVSVLRALGIHKIQGFYFQKPAESGLMVKVLTTSFDVPEAAGELV